MSTFSAVYGAYNVQGSFNQWLYKNITAYGAPAWMPSARVVYDWGVEKPLISGYSGHAFSVNHLGDLETTQFQGETVDNGSAGNMRRGQVEVNCWVSKQAAGNQHMARLRQMRDMVSRLAHNKTFPIANLYASTATAPGATARGVIEGVEFNNPQGDPINPDMWRTRAVIGYSWLERDG